LEKAQDLGYFCSKTLDANKIRLEESKSSNLEWSQIVANIRRILDFPVLDRSCACESCANLIQTLYSNTQKLGERFSSRDATLVKDQKSSIFDSLVIENVEQVSSFFFFF